MRQNKLLLAQQKGQSNNKKNHPGKAQYSAPIAITDKATLKALSECGEVGGVGKANAWHLAGAVLGVAIVHPDPSEKFQILLDIGQAASNVS